MQLEIMFIGFESIEEANEVMTRFSRYSVNTANRLTAETRIGKIDQEINELKANLALIENDHEAIRTAIQSKTEAREALLRLVKKQPNPGDKADLRGTGDQHGSPVANPFGVVLGGPLAQDS